MEDYYLIATREMSIHGECITTQQSMNEMLLLQQSQLSKDIRTKHIAPVWLETLGCQIFVSNFIFGGSKGYCFGISILTWNNPPSYGVPSGPLMVPFKCRRSPGTTGMAITPDVPSSFPTSWSSFANRPFADDMLMERVIALSYIESRGKEERDRNTWTRQGTLHS